MMMDCCKHNQVVTAVVVGVPAVVLFVEQINTYPHNLYAAINLLMIFFYIPVSKDHWKQFVFS